MDRSKLDVRSLPARDLEIREGADGAAVLRGYAAVFNSLSNPIGGIFRERIAPGAFRSTIESDQDVYAFWQHDSSRPLARRSIGTLRLREDEIGLAVEFDVPNTPSGQEARGAIAEGLVDTMSFGFFVPEGGDRLLDERSDDGYPIRELVNVDLFEVSPVTFPAYDSTAISARSAEFSKFVESRRAGVELRRRRLRMIERGG